MRLTIALLVGLFSSSVALASTEASESPCELAEAQTDKEYNFFVENFSTEIEFQEGITEEEASEALSDAASALAASINGVIKRNGADMEFLGGNMKDSELVEPAHRGLFFVAQYVQTASQGLRFNYNWARAGKCRWCNRHDQHGDYRHLADASLLRELNDELEETVTDPNIKKLTILSYKQDESPKTLSLVAVANAEIDVDFAQVLLAAREHKVGGSPNELDGLRASLACAESKLEEAQEQYQVMIDGVTTDELTVLMKDKEVMDQSKLLVEKKNHVVVLEELP